ncbi:hypothetical protein [Ammoniphilus resinae]|uniref:Uncharacterized protein n=1 Tax=Ammoniphilus resinae TaxID=861532 RepID=A0ABS4GJB6_9BACL|nr:hypothetical protein [Ammoniphilus resinae]MBP1930351.1 hypothetical protein [Ammoniphilus resinae]
MKTIQEANEELLQLLFCWKRKEGKFIRFSIEQVEENWVLSFYSVNTQEQDKHLFASFTGKSHDELKRWALDRLVTYTLSIQT